MRILTRTLAVALMLAVSGCGGGSGSSTTSTTSSSSSPTDNFPSGLALASPTAVTTSTTTTASIQAPFTTMLADWAHSLHDAVADRDGGRLRTLLLAALPLGNAHAAPSAKPEFQNLTSFLDTIRLGSAKPTNANMAWNDFFQTSTNANCYGPSLAYAAHDNGSGGSGTLPGGDLGIWASYENLSTPCSAAQLNRLASSVKKKGNSSLILAASMIYVANQNSVLPAAGASADIKTAFDTFVKAIDPAITVDVATIARSTANVWTYTLRASTGSGNTAQSIIVNLTHTPGSSAGEFTGLLKYAALSLGSDAAFGCSDEMSGSLYKIASAGTVRYTKTSSTDAAFGSRESRYCGHTASSTATDMAEIAALDGNGELDPAVALASNTRGSSKGWRGDFRRFGAAFDPATYAGNFLFAWQAGTGDDKSRMFAVNTAYDSSTETRTGKAFFGFGDAIKTTTGALLGMICNWAGPGNSHATGNNFQHQQISLSASATEWTLSTDKIKYAPTTSCNSSSSMTYDDNVDGTIAASEGASTTNALDGLTGSNTTVASELAARGYTAPTMF